MFSQDKAIVLREVTYKEADRILTLLTAGEGKITAKARGALRKNSKVGAGTQCLTYSDMTFLLNAGRYTVTEASIIEPFQGLRADLEALALADYFAECTDAVLLENQPEPEVLQLLLNCLFAVSGNLHPFEKIKAVFEMRLMCLCGYEPDLSVCARCAEEVDDLPVFGIRDGRIYHKGCCNAPDATVLTMEELQVLRYIVEAPPKKILSFTCTEDTMRGVARVCERYLMVHTERKFGTLDYYKKVKI